MSLGRIYSGAELIKLQCLAIIGVHHVYPRNHVGRDHLSTYLLSRAFLELKSEATYLAYYGY